MARYRIGNDMTILWTITNHDGSAFPLAGKDVRLYYTCERGRFEANAEIQGNNVIAWNFLGSEQRALGSYTLTFEILQSDGKRTIKRDLCDAFTLVGKNCEEKYEQGGAYINEGGVINLATELDIYRISPIIPYVVRDENGIAYWYVDGVNTGDRSTGESAYEYAVFKGYQGTEDEFASILALAPTNHDSIVKIEETLTNKADKTGRYPDMSVGFADDLVGRGESTPAEFSFRASGGKSIKDGAARIKRLRGNSVVWNNVVDLVNMPANAAGVTATELDGRRIHLQGEFTNEGDRNLYVLDKQDIVEEHYYAVILQGSKYYGIYGYGGIVTGSTDAAVVLATGTGSGLTLLPRTSIDAGTYVDEIVIPQIIDLTLMFGAGNEPTTIEEYCARKPIVEDEYAYNEGEVIHMAADGIKSVGDNAWDEEWECNGSYVEGVNSVRVLPNTEYYVNSPDYVVISVYDKNDTLLATYERKNNAFTTPANASYLQLRLSSSYGTTYNNDIMISLVHSGWKQDTDAGYQPYWEDRLMFDQRIKEHFPDGMQKWDMVYNKNGKGYIVKGTGVVDMGELNWAYYPANESYPYGFFVASCDDRANGVATINARYVNGGNFSIDKNVFGNMSASNVYSVDSDYTDAATFKAAMAGVLLYYELADPTIIEYDELFNLDYRVADFGTEEAIAYRPSAPIAADIIYQFNAVDMIRELWLKVQELEKKLGL